MVDFHWPRKPHESEIRYVRRFWKCLQTYRPAPSSFWPVLEASCSTTEYSKSGSLGMTTYTPVMRSIVPWALSSCGR